jgi:hypothetical protein
LNIYKERKIIADDNILPILIEEIDNYQSLKDPIFSNHHLELSKIAESFKLNDNFKNPIESLVTSGEKFKINHFASNYDDFRENKNINDKLWKTCFKFGEIFVNELSHVKQDKFGPFTVPSTDLNAACFINLKFSENFQIKYFYKKGTNSQNTINNNQYIYPMKYLEFQLIVFNKIIYNRVINRDEIWKLLYHCTQKNISTLSPILIEIKNAEYSDGVYDRVALLS